VARARKLSNAALGLTCLAVFVAMVGMAFASVPLYRAFCQATGFYGTARRATSAAATVSNRTVTVRFDTNVRGLSWRFEPEQASQTMRLGENKLAFFRATNTGDRPITGRAVYNVTPLPAGPYFSKLECFCFKNQTLAPGQTAEFPVVYFVDPRYGTNADTKGTPEITLSYTFFPAVTGPRVSSNEGSRAPPGASPLGGSRRAGL
jgi:cytochrome c oxidase assembly protein subunit 11